jgi:hypothetical protein
VGKKLSSYPYPSDQVSIPELPSIGDDKRVRERERGQAPGNVESWQDAEDFFQLFLFLEMRCVSDGSSEFGGIGDVFNWIWTLLNLVLSVFGGPVCLWSVEWTRLG